MFRKIIGIFLSILVLFPTGGFPQGSSCFASSWIVKGNPYSAQVIVIEDLHYSQECQRSIVNTVLSLVKKRKVQVIFLEGALKGKIDLRVWQPVIGVDKARKVIDNLWRQGRLTAGEYLSFRLLDKVEFYGLEDYGLYLDHLRLMQDWVPTLKVIEKDIYPEKFWNLAQRRDKQFSKEILDYIRAKNPELALVIVGGYHAKAIVPELMASSISVSWLRPKVYSLSTREKEKYFASFLSLGSALALPMRVDYRVNSMRFWQLWNRVVRPIKVSEKLEHPLRLPYPLWQRLSETVKRADLDLYYLLKGKGFAWTDYTGKVHTIDEIIRFCDRENGVQTSAFLWGLLANELVKFYHKKALTIPSGMKFAENMAFLHEKLHWLLINEPSIKKKMLSSARQVLGKQLSNYLDWTIRIYGRPPRRFKLKRKKEIDWCLEELLVISYQEYSLRSSLFDYADALEKLGVDFPEDREEFVRKLQKLAELWQPYKKFISKVSISKEKYEIDWFKNSIASLSSKKIKKLADLVLKYCEGKKFPEGESYIHHVSSLFTFVRVHRSRDFRLAAMSLVHVMSLPEAEQALTQAGFSEKEIDSLLKEMQVYKLIFEFPYSFDESKPLPSPDFLNNLNEYLYQVIELNHAISGFRLAAYDLLVSLAEEGVLYEEEKDRYLRLAKYLIIPLAERLGVNWLFFELKDMLYRYEHPGVYYSTLARVREGLKGKTEQEFADEIISRVYSAVPELNEYKYFWRMKSISSIVEKQKRRRLDISAINDIFGMKIVVPYPNQARDVTNRLASYLSVQVEERKVKGGSYFILQFKHNSFPCEIQVRDNNVEEILEKTHLAHWRYNLKKVLPPAWRAQRFRAYNWQKNPVLFLVRSFITPQSKETQWQLVRFSTLKENYDKFLPQSGRLYIFSPYQYLFPSRSSTREELDLQYFSQKRVLSRIKEQPDAIFVYSNKISLFEILRWMRTWFDSTPYKQLLLVGLFLGQMLTGHLFGLHCTDYIPWIGMFLGSITFVSPFPVIWQMEDGRMVKVESVNNGKLKLILDDIQYIVDLFDSQGDLIIHIKNDLPLPLLKVLIKKMEHNLGDSNLLFLCFDNPIALESKIKRGLLLDLPSVKVSDNILVYSPRIKDIVLCFNWFRWKVKHNISNLLPLSDWEFLLASSGKEEFIERFAKVYFEKLKHIDKKLDVSQVNKNELKFLKEMLEILNDTWLRMDVKKLVQNITRWARDSYPDGDVRVRNKIKLGIQLYSCAFVPSLVKEVIGLIFRCKGKEVRLELWEQDGRLYVRIQGIGKDINRRKLAKSISENSTNDKGETYLPLLIKSLRQTGGDIRIILPSRGKGQGNRYSKSVKAETKKNNVPSSVIIEFSAPAWQIERRKQSNKFSVTVISGKNTNKTNWKAISYASKYGFYYLSLDNITTFLLARLSLEHRGLWHLIFADDWDTVNNALPVIVEKELSRLDVKSEGIYWNGIDLNLGISNLGFEAELDGYLSRNEAGLKGEGLEKRITEKVSKLVYHYLNQVIIPELKRLGFKGVVIVSSTHIPSIDRGDEKRRFGNG